MKKACLMGHPVAHSRSPMIHGYWLRQLGIDGSYGREDVLPDDLPEFLAGLARRGYSGGNVTVPHKEAAFRLVDEATARARSLETVNTVWLQDGRLIGDNTDVLGFVNSLDAVVPGWDHTVEAATVIGAGGGARAVVAGLLDRGISEIAVVNRSAARAEALAQHFGKTVRAVDWTADPSLLQATQLLVNATSLGMRSQPPLDFSLTGLRPDAVVADIVYVPLETPLLAAARQRGNRVVDGLGMLLHQAAPAFERFFGIMPSVTPKLRTLVEADILGVAK